MDIALQSARTSERGRQDRLVPVCALKHVPAGRGALVTVDGEKVALFRAHDDTVWAVGNRNPYTGADHVARGRLGRVGTTPVVVSPLYRLVFDLRTGACLNAIGLPQLRLTTYAVDVRDDVVHVGPSTGRERPSPTAVPVSA